MGGGARCLAQGSVDCAQLLDCTYVHYLEPSKPTGRAPQARSLLGVTRSHPPAHLLGTLMLQHTLLLLQLLQHLLMVPLWRQQRRAAVQQCGLYEASRRRRRVALRGWGVAAAACEDNRAGRTLAHHARLLHSHRVGFCRRVVGELAEVFRQGAGARQRRRQRPPDLVATARWRPPRRRVSSTAITPQSGREA